MAVEGIGSLVQILADQLSGQTPEIHQRSETHREQETQETQR